MPNYVILGNVIGWILTVFIGLLAARILWMIWLGGKEGIDLKYLISDERGYASLSRFQFLIFTFVVALSLFYLTVLSPDHKFPDVPGNILALLGISGGSYVVSQGIQSSRDVGITQASGNPPPEAPDRSQVPPPANPSANNPNPGPVS